MKNQIKTIIIVLALVLSSSAFAGGNDRNHRHTRWCGHNQNSESNDSSDDSSDDNGSSDGNTDSVPLDGGLSILLLGAAAFGVKKLRDKKNGTI